MDTVKLQLFKELFKELTDRLSLPSSIYALLDFLHSHSSFDTPQAFSDFYRLVEQNRTGVLDALKSALSDHPSGYDIVIDFVQRDEYHWMYDKYTNRERIFKITTNEIEKALKLGTVPSKPRFYIERESVMAHLKRNVFNADTSCWFKINVHGMTGVGKTNLVAACVRDRQVQEFAKHKIFWIDLHRADSLSDDDCVDHLFALYHKLLVSDDTLAFLPSDKPARLSIIQERLRSLFLRSPYDKAIIVLDNVASSIALQHFDVCNLIAISQEKFNSDAFTIHHLSLNEMFSVEETMQVFKLALNCTLDKCFESDCHLYDIVQWCNGDPTTIAICASLMVDRRQSLKNSNHAWEIFKEDLCREDGRVRCKRNHTIAFCVRNLPEHLYTKYTDLAIFVPDVNITAHVLALLWDIHESEVDDIMLQLRDKSLVVREYNPVIQSYFYGVHPILLNYLQANNKSLKITHQQLILAYERRYKEYHKFKDDNYIFQYIGYHLRQAEMNESFRIYTDLKFIAAKIRAAGVADTLEDLELYFEDESQHDEHVLRVIDELKEFVEQHGHHLERYPHANIIQSALQLSVDNLIYKLAMQEVAKDPFGLYFRWKSSTKDNYYIHHLNVENDFKVACFTCNSDYLLIGTESGDIQLWYQCYDKISQIFKDHTEAITFLQASDSKFISIAHDGVVKLWPLDKYESRRNSNICKSSQGDINSPSMKQKSHQNFFATNCTDECATFTSSDGAALISADFSADLLVAGSQKGKLHLWSNGVLQYDKNLPNPITSLQFSRNATSIFAACETSIMVYDTTDGVFLSKICCKKNILRLHTLRFQPEDHFIAVQEHQVIHCRINRNNNTAQINQNVIVSKDNASMFICSSVTDQYLVLGSNDRTIFMWDLLNNVLMEELHAQYGNVICIDANTNSEDRSIDILLTAYEDKSVKLWHITPGEKPLQNCEAVDTIAAFVPQAAGDTSDFAIAFSRGSTLTIQLTDARTTEVTTNGIISHLTVFQDCFLYALDDGKVFMHKNTNSAQLFDLNAPLTFLKVVNESVFASATNMLYKYCNGNMTSLIISNADEARAVMEVFQTDSVLVIAEDEIFKWDTMKKCTQSIVINVHQYGASCAASDGRICVTHDNVFLILDSASNSQTKTSSQTLTSCCFSHDSTLLALGTCKGDIEIWTMETMTLQSTLRLHESAVAYLQFSPKHRSILLSQADQLTWWNLNLISASSRNSSCTSQVFPARRSFRSRSNSVKKKPPPLTNLMSTLDVAGASILLKRGPSGAEHLLNTIKLHGASTSRVAHSKDFTAFFCVDNLGNFYNLQIIDDVETFDK